MKSRAEEMRESVVEFHKEHPEVWDLFVKFTFEKINRGFKHYSVNAIFERIRWETESGADGVNIFKISNNHHAFYSRRFMKIYPSHEGFFRTRIQTSETRLATNLPELTPNHWDTQQKTRCIARQQSHSGLEVVAGGKARQLTAGSHLNISTKTIGKATE